MKTAKTTAVRRWRCKIMIMKTCLSTLLAALALLAVGTPAQAATITWINTSGGNWSNTNNWSPPQVPTNTDNVLITTPGTYTVSLDVVSSFYLTNYTTNVANLTLGAGGGAAGVQTFVVTNLVSTAPFHVNSQLLVTNGGALRMTNGYLSMNSLIIDQGGVFNGQGETFTMSSAIVNGGVLNTANGNLASIIVTNGGVLNANGDTLGSVTVANGGLCLANRVAISAPYLGYGMAVAHGGVLDITNGLSLYAPLINSGTINLTNTGIYVVNYDDYQIGQVGGGGLVNQPGGLINWQGAGNISGEHSYYKSVPLDYFINQGMITRTGGTNTVDCQVFDNTAGTITNLSGTLALGSYQTNLAGTYYAAADATIQFNAVNDGTNFVSAGTPLVLAGSGQYQFLSGDLYYPTNTITNLALLGTTLKLGPDFQGGTITNLALDGIALSNSLPITGWLAATNSRMAVNFTVAGGGVFTESNSATFGAITVASGGLFMANAGSVNPSYSGTNLTGSLIVARGGAVNLAGNFGLTVPFTNAGTVNLSNAVINVAYAPPDNMLGGIVNQAGGLMNLGTNVAINIDQPNVYFINQGMIVQLPGAGSTNTISCSAEAQVGTQLISFNVAFAFDNRQGTISNWSGTLALSGFQTNLAGTFYTAEGATTQLGGGTAATPLGPGTPLVLGGSGQYQFYSGYLYLATNTIPNLSLVAGLLELGPGFQDGAITNLTLTGIALTNQLSTTLPIQGMLTVRDSGGSGTLNLLYYGRWDGYYGNGVYGDYVVAGGGVLNVSNATMNGAVAVANNGRLNMDGALMYGSVAAATGGLITVTGGSTQIERSDPLTMAAGATMNITGAALFLYGPLNNAGTINITNLPSSFYSGIFTYNDGSADNRGGVLNQASGLINLGDTTYLKAMGGGYEYLVNQGTIIKSAGTNFCWLDVPCFTNSGAITIQSGDFRMRPFVILSGGSLNVGLNSATDYGSFIVTTTGPALTGTQALAGAFNATLNHGYVPASGATFDVLSYGAFTGSFASLGLPSAVSWQTSYGSTNFTLAVGNPKPQFGTFNSSGTNLIFNGIGGSPGSNYMVLVSTNLTLALTNWSVLTTNKFDSRGQFHYTNHVNPAKPRQFFIFKLP